jgi:hypothetical protein
LGWSDDPFATKPKTDIKYNPDEIKGSTGKGKPFQLEGGIRGKIAVFGVPEQ